MFSPHGAINIVAAVVILLVPLALFALILKACIGIASPDNPRNNFWRALGVTVASVVVSVVLKRAGAVGGLVDGLISGFIVARVYQLGFWRGYFTSLGASFVLLVLLLGGFLVFTRVLHKADLTALLSRGTGAGSSWSLSSAAAEPALTSNAPSTGAESLADCTGIIEWKDGDSTSFADSIDEVPERFRKIARCRGHK